MSFTITLMNNQQELNKISKTPATVMSVTGSLRENTDIVDPQINIEYNGTLTNVNYMYIAEFHRYYFITKIESIRTGLWRVYAHCDVLKTYSQAILGTKAVISRSESDYNLLLNDQYFKAYANPRIQLARFSETFSGNSYVLIMQGAKYTHSS